MNIVDSLKNYAGSALAFSRYVGAYAGGAVTVVGILGFTAVTPDQINQLIAALQDLGTGLSKVFASLGTITSVCLAIWGAIKATRAQQTKTVSQIPGVQVHVDTAPASPAPAAVKALVTSHDPTVHDVVPMNGPPVVKP